MYFSQTITNFAKTCIKYPLSSAYKWRAFYSNNHFEKNCTKFSKLVVKGVVFSAYKWGVFLFASVNLENRIPSNINTLLCFARKGKAAPYSAPWRWTGCEEISERFFLYGYDLLEGSNAMTETEPQWYFCRVPDIARTAARMTGEVKSLCVQPSTVYIAAQCRGSSVKYGKLNQSITLSRMRLMRLSFVIFHFYFVISK